MSGSRIALAAGAQDPNTLIVPARRRRIAGLEAANKAGVSAAYDIVDRRLEPGPATSRQHERRNGLDDAKAKTSPPTAIQSHRRTRGVGLHG